MKLVLVHWRDANGGGRHGWRPLAGMVKDNLDPVTSAGYLLEKNDDFIMVVPHVSKDEGDGEVAIPASWVVKIVELQAKPDTPKFEEPPQHTDPTQLAEDKENG